MKKHYLSMSKQEFEDYLKELEKINNEIKEFLEEMRTENLLLEAELLARKVFNCGRPL